MPYTGVLGLVRVGCECLYTLIVGHPSFYKLCFLPDRGQVAGSCPPVHDGPVVEFPSLSGVLSIP